MATLKQDGRLPVPPQSWILNSFSWVYYRLTREPNFTLSSEPSFGGWIFKNMFCFYIARQQEIILRQTVSSLALEDWCFFRETVFGSYLTKQTAGHFQETLISARSRKTSGLHGRNACESSVATASAHFFIKTQHAARRSIVVLLRLTHSSGASIHWILNIFGVIYGGTSSVNLFHIPALTTNMWEGWGWGIKTTCEYNFIMLAYFKNKGIYL